MEVPPGLGGGGWQQTPAGGASSAKGWLRAGLPHPSSQAAPGNTAIRPHIAHVVKSDVHWGMTSPTKQTSQQRCLGSLEGGLDPPSQHRGGGVGPLPTSKPKGAMMYQHNKLPDSGSTVPAAANGNPWPNCSVGKPQESASFSLQVETRGACQTSH